MKKVIDKIYAIEETDLEKLSGNNDEEWIKFIELVRGVFDQENIWKADGLILKLLDHKKRYKKCIIGRVIQHFLNQTHSIQKWYCCLTATELLKKTREDYARRKEKLLVKLGESYTQWNSNRQERLSPKETNDNW